MQDFPKKFSLKKILTLLVLSFFAVSILTPHANADGGPRNENFYVVVGAIACLPVIVFAVWGIWKLLKHKEKEPVTAVLFDQEEVFLKIDGNNKMEVDASFEYQNTTSKRLKMDLFFPLTSLLQTSIRDISVLLIHPTQEYNQKEEFLKYKPDGNRILFDFVLEPKEKVYLKVHYVESFVGNKAEYIITTIKRWKRPVAQAVFHVQLPSDKKTPTFSFENYLVEKIYLKELEAFVYTFRILDLYPDKEFQIALNE